MKNILIIFMISTLFLGCTSRPPAPPAKYANKLPFGAINLDINSDDQFSIKNSLGSVLQKKIHDNNNSNQKIPFDILTLTGGGSRGAFGTGFLAGWNDKGDMPKFDIVTGISTGAVMAPFIFLGEDELKKVKDFYTKTNTEEVFQQKWLSFFGFGYIMDAKPLKKLFKQTFNKEFLDKIAYEHKHGRRLYIGTTNIDTGQLTV